jgi:hypothetical protein
MYQAYCKARNVIDDLIYQVEEKNSITANTIATIQNVN